MMDMISMSFQLIRYTIGITAVFVVAICSVYFFYTGRSPAKVLIALISVIWISKTAECQKNCALLVIEKEENGKEICFKGDVYLIVYMMTYYQNLVRKQKSALEGSKQEWIMDPAGMAECKKQCLNISDREYYPRKTVIHPSYAGTVKTSL